MAGSSMFLFSLLSLTMHMVQAGAYALVRSERQHKVPRQLIFTAKPQFLQSLPQQLQANVYKNAFQQNVNPNLKVRYFGDQACHNYIKKFYDEELLGFFDHAHPGYYRGDICRAAILYNEGGFYVDIDVELAKPIDALIDADTTFMSVYSIKGDVFNGLLASVPKGEVLRETLHEIRKWYRNETSHENMMGTMTMNRALVNVIKDSCPTLSLNAQKNSNLQWPCGNENIRMYKEGDLLCYMKQGEPQPRECPMERKSGTDLLMRYGFFIPGQRVNTHREIIGWPRFVYCQDPQNGCGSGGHASLLETSVEIRHHGSLASFQSWFTNEE